MSVRDYNQEHRDTADKKYFYDFDAILRRYMMQTFEPFLVPGKSLELGCYKGDFTEILAERLPDLTVVEASDELIEHTRQRVRKDVTFVHSTFETLEPADRYDSVFLVHTLEHLDNPIEVLSAINGWLSERGRLFLAVPNANAASRQIAVKMGLISHNAAVTESEAVHGHRCTYALDTLERDAKAAGLRVVQRGGVIFKPLANFQFDKALADGTISDAYVEGCYQLGMVYPDLCASVYLICEKG
ncbi:MAG: class I SAM-dependent methyltransferase [Alphaproteobacteria bacterium]|nr:class I SAM-dependent methyltransferase [Alphaproteobacteria bacterium]MBU1514517.1 class I SAM-dependent methyltransferase [Alphaproteobacteria bacterium]MBU2096851.1 class I SAM-dependent methyltransferase [Alphaproteobacteria bacterium]MBU2153478.1 class I SAM-dependent methyltransferase [Alphaproteobacteria bacterium]MBU2306017.1 class I SAM-dependent methyltransferase [Alphaproteobacteria bacterium]